ncbi:MAG: hypothetical protein ABEH90_00320 [Halolamina sp.]
MKSGESVVRLPVFGVLRNRLVGSRVSYGIYHLTGRCGSMTWWKTVGSVISGVMVTVILTVLALLSLPFLGFATSEMVGNWVPVWLFILPPVVSASIGGATTGFLLHDTPRRSAILGCLATAFGLTAVGAVIGLGFLVVMLGMTPAHGQTGNLSEAVRTMLTLGGGAGFVAGAVLGAIGGAGGHIVREKSGL